MTHAAEKIKVGRQPFVACELDLDYCSNLYGGGLISPADGTCTANAASGSECYNTFQTCQDRDNFVKEAKTYRFSQPVLPVPDIAAIPCIKGAPVTTSAKIDPESGLGSRTKVVIKMNDFPHHDRGFDPYVAGRSYTPQEQGTFWGKFLARNPFYVGRPMRIRSGYLGDAFDWANFQDRIYVIDSMVLNKDGTATITGKDIMKLLDDDRAQIPPQSVGVLAADLTDVAGSTTLEAGDGAAYPASGSYRIGNEIGTFTRVVDAITLVTRSDWGSEADTHDAGDVFQWCYVLDDTNVVDFIFDVLTTYGGIDPVYIPYDAGQSPPTGTNDEWDDEHDLWLTSFNLSGIISEPEGVASVLKKTGTQCGVFLWWQELDSEIKLKANMPPPSNAVINDLTDAHHLLEDTVTVKELPDRRISQAWGHYSKIDATEDDKASNYQSTRVHASAAMENANAYGVDNKKVRQIFGTYIRDGNLASAITGRLVSRFGLTPKEISFEVDAKDQSYQIGDLVNVVTRAEQTVTGETATYQLQIISAAEIEGGGRWRYKGLTSNFLSRYVFIAPASLASTPYTSATDEEQRKYGFIADGVTGLMSNGDAPYLII